MIKSFDQFINENLTSLVDRYKNQKGQRLEDMDTISIGGHNYEWDDICENWIYKITSSLNGKVITTIGYYAELEPDEDGERDSFDYVLVLGNEQIVVDRVLTDKDVDDIVNQSNTVCYNHKFFKTSHDALDDLETMVQKGHDLPNSAKHINDIHVLPFEDITADTPDGYYISIPEKQ